MFPEKRCPASFLNQKIKVFPPSLPKSNTLGKHVFKQRLSTASPCLVFYLFDKKCFYFPCSDKGAILVFLTCILKFLKKITSLLLFFLLFPPTFPSLELLIVSSLVGFNFFQFMIQNFLEKEPLTPFLLPLNILK